MEILLVDDSTADAYLTKLALTEALPDSHVRVAEDGEQALQYLAGTDNYSANIHPDLILLDLNMPRLDGLSLLRLIKALPECRATPVIILTTSNWSHDIDRAYQLGALKYFTKPANWHDYVTLGSAIASVWDRWHANAKSVDVQISQ